jgi:hypothetical protein
MAARKFFASNVDIQCALPGTAVSCRQAPTLAQLGWLILSLWLLSTLGGTVYAEKRPPNSAMSLPGVAGKPEGLDEADWASLKAAVRKSTGQQTLLSANSVAGADGALEDVFGYSVALSGDTALVGTSADDVGSNFNQGSVYVFVLSGTSWILQAKLVAGDGSANDLYGVSVALSGDTALVGAYADDVGNNIDQGSAYVFTRKGTSWAQQAKLVAGDGAAYDHFGLSVALSGNTALVGAYSDDINANNSHGSAYVFSRAGTSWAQQARLVHQLPGDGEVNDLFGWSVALSGDTALVGAYADGVGVNNEQGSAYVFIRTGTVWTPQAKLVAGDGAGGDRFGWSVALSGDTALVGAYADGVGSNFGQGSAYVFTRIGTNWTQHAQLLAGDGAAFDEFGASVALSGDTALVGANRDDAGANGDQGSAYVFTRIGTNWTQQAQLAAGDGEVNDLFGYSVALSGDKALAGAWADDVGINPEQGSAYVFARTGTLWSQQTQLVSGDGAANDFFGWSVALSGDTAVVGAYLDNVGGNRDQGSAYVFTRTGTAWTQQAHLVAGDGAADDQFGSSVALVGDTALVGAFRDDVGADTDHGSVYVFIRTGASWSQQAKLMVGAGNDLFGSSVALYGDTALVGAYTDSVGAHGAEGSAYVFVRTGTSWNLQAQLVPGDGASLDEFGYSVALSGDTALVGASADDIGTKIDQGSAYVFVRTGTSWTEQAQLVSGNGAANDIFGASVALSGDTALVGALSSDVGVNIGQGSAYVFTRVGGTWSQQVQLVAGDGAAFDRFGSSVALSGDTALVGATEDDIGNFDQGSAYLFKRVGTNWIPQFKLIAGDGASGDQFGNSVALSGDAALVGAKMRCGPPPYGNPYEGAAYVFVDSGIDVLFTDGDETPTGAHGAPILEE